MIWKLEDLIDYSNNIKHFHKNKYVPCKPLNDAKEYYSIFNRIKDALEVIKGKANVFKWPIDY